jgi:hypothetical protein
MLAGTPRICTVRVARMDPMDPKSYQGLAKAVERSMNTSYGLPPPQLSVSGKPAEPPLKLQLLRASYHMSCRVCVEQYVVHDG